MSNKIFISYSHKDEQYRVELETHLSALKRNGLIDTLTDRKILPGQDWDKEIKKGLEEAQLVLFLVSADFLASDYCYDVEVRKALQRHDSKEAVVVPVIVRQCDWKNTPFSKLQALPSDAKPIKNWPDNDGAYLDVVNGIKSLLEKQNSLREKSITILPSVDFFKSKEIFKKKLTEIISDKDSVFYKEIKERSNSYSLLDNAPFLNKLIRDSLSKSIDFGLLLIISDFVNRHLYNDQQAKYVYNQPHVSLHNRDDEGYDMLVYYHIRFIGILYSTAILNKIDIDTVSNTYGNMQGIFSSMIEGMVNNLNYTQDDNEEEYPTNFHWLISELFSIAGNWLTTFNEEEYFVKTSSYLKFIPFSLKLCFLELYKGIKKNKISEKFIVDKYYYGVITHYFSPLLNDFLRESIEANIIVNIPNELIRPIFKYSLNDEYAINYDEFIKGDFRFLIEKEREILNRLRTFLDSNNKL